MTRTGIEIREAAVQYKPVNVLPESRWLRQLARCIEYTIGGSRDAGPRETRFCSSVVSFKNTRETSLLDALRKTFAFWVDAPSRPGSISVYSLWSSIKLISSTPIIFPTETHCQPGGWSSGDGALSNWIPVRRMKLRGESFRLDFGLLSAATVKFSFFLEKLIY